MNRTKKHIEALHADDDATRWEGVRTLKALEADHWDDTSDADISALVEALCQQLPRRSETSGARLPTHLRRDVAFILGKLGARAADAVPTLTELLKEDEPEGIREAARPQGSRRRLRARVPRPRAPSPEAPLRRGRSRGRELKRLHDTRSPRAGCGRAVARTHAGGSAAARWQRCRRARR